MSLIEKVKPIRLFVLDVDGVLTTGILYLGNDEMEMKGFHVHDGFGIKLLQQSGIDIAIISARKSASLNKRLKELSIEHVYLGQENKLIAFEALKQKLQLSNHEIAYMGDDLPDLPLLRRVGFSATVKEAPAIIQENVDFITTKNAGLGAVREVCDFILNAQGKYQSMLQLFLV